MKLEKPKEPFVFASPCPFCGSKKRDVRNNDEYYVQCLKPTCYATGPVHKKRYKAIQLWNKG